MKKNRVSLVTLCFVLAAVMAPTYALAQWTCGSGVCSTSDDVGIGTTTPQAPVDTGSTIGPKLYLYNDGTYGDGFGQYSFEFRNFMDTSGGTTHMTWGKQTLSGTYTEFMRLTANGALGVGTTSPGTGLDLNGAFTERAMAAPSLSSSGQGIIYFDSTSNQFKASQNGGAFAALIGNSSQWITSGSNIYYNIGAVSIGTSAQSGSAALTIASSLAFSPTTGGIIGTVNADNANAGEIGEFRQSQCDNAISGSTVTISIASPAVMTATDHGIISGDGTNDGGICPIVFATTGTLPTGITAGTVYWTIGSSLTANTFKIATSIANAIAGTAVNTSGTQTGTQTATAGVPMSNTTFNSLSAISLSSGDWDVRASFQLLGSGTFTNTQTIGYISTVSATEPTHWAATGPGNIEGNLGASEAPWFALGTIRANISSTTVYYCEGYARYTGTEPQAVCTISARRIR